MIDLRDKFLLMFAPFGQGHKSPQPFVICIIDDVWTVIYGISQTLACSRSAAVRIHSFTLFHININSGPAGFITYSHATNKLEVVFCQLFFTLVADCPHFCLCRLLDIMDEVQAVMYFSLYPFYVAVDERTSFNVAP